MLEIKYIGQRLAYSWCPYHNDKKNGQGRPSLVINLEGPHASEWHCFSCGKSGRVSKDALIKMSKAKKHKEPLKDFNWQKLSDEYAFKLAWEQDERPFPITIQTVLVMMMGWDGESWTFPERNADNEIIGILRRFPDGFKAMVDGSSRGLSIPQISWNSELPILITEGVSDLYTILDLGYQGIGRANCDLNSEILLCLLRNGWDINSVKETSYIISDNDEQGVKGAIKLAETLGLHGSHVLIPESKDIRQMLIDKGRDKVSDWLRKNIK